jgi:nitrite reductase/ring-hydroxylating ferredoxin subunit
MRFNTNVQNICKLQSFSNKLHIITMQKLLLLFVIVGFISCEKNDTQDILPNINVNVTVNLDLPQYIDLQTPSGWAYTNGGLKGIIIQNTGLTPKYKAFERACPNNDCVTPMTFDGSLKLKCSCDNSEYSIIDGTPQTSGNSQFAREYKVNVVNSKTLIITNY